MPLSSSSAMSPNDPFRQGQESAVEPSRMSEIEHNNMDSSKYKDDLSLADSNEEGSSANSHGLHQTGPSTPAVKNAPGDLVAKETTAVM